MPFGSRLKIRKPKGILRLSKSTFSRFLIAGGRLDHMVDKNRELYNGVTEQTKAGKHRLEDAAALLKEKRWRGAMYMAGYSVECLLKSKLMGIYHCNHLSELEETLVSRALLKQNATVYSHDLELLLRLTGGMDRARKSVDVWRSFGRVNTWIPAWRYYSDVSDSQTAAVFMGSVEAFSDWVVRNL